MSWLSLDDDGNVRLVDGRLIYLDDNAPEAVRQRVRARLLLARGEWFADLDDGIDWHGLVRGSATQQEIEQQVRARISETAGVLAIEQLQFARSGRELIVTFRARVGEQTIFDEVTV
jgi:hypothetical protein